MIKIKKEKQENMSFSQVFSFHNENPLVTQYTDRFPRR